MKLKNLNKTERS